MAILEIKKFNDPVLRKRCESVKKIDRDIKKFVVDIAQTMKKNKGNGLAAPQVGVLKRIIVVQADLENQHILGLINPIILETSRKKKKNIEGCLSFPGIFLKIKRATKIEVEGLDIRGKKIKLEAKGLLARVFQHEIDHLDGILFFKRLNFLQKIKFKLKYPSIY